MSSEVTIASLALEASVRRYRIEAIIREKPDLEAPSEAALKALFVAERISEAALTRYLGLEADEFGVIVAELMDLSLVFRSGPDLKLTEKGKQAIDPLSEGRRRQNVTATLAFEDTTFAEVLRERSKPWTPTMSSGTPPDDGRPAAAEAFREGFLAWRGREGHGSPGDVLSRVVNVAPLGRQSALVTAPVVLAPTSNAAFIDVSRIELGSMTSPERREACAERFRETVDRLHCPTDGSNALRWISDQIMPIPGDPVADPVEWARRARSGDLSVPEGTCLVSESAPSFIVRGAVPFPNAEPMDFSDEDPSGMPSVGFWTPPEGDTWLLDADLDAAVGRLKSHVIGTSNEEAGLIVAIFRLRKGEEKNVERTWRLNANPEPFNAGVLAASLRINGDLAAPGVGEPLPQSLELIVVPGGFVVAVAHMLSERAPIPIPVGIATSDLAAVNRATSHIRERIAACNDTEWRTPGADTGRQRTIHKVKASLEDVGNRKA